MSHKMCPDCTMHSNSNITRLRLKHIHEHELATRELDHASK